MSFPEGRKAIDFFGVMACEEDETVDIESLEEPVITNPCTEVEGSPVTVKEETLLPSRCVKIPQHESYLEETHHLDLKLSLICHRAGEPLQAVANAECAGGHSHGFAETGAQKDRTEMVADLQRREEEEVSNDEHCCSLLGNVGIFTEVAEGHCNELNQPCDCQDRTAFLAARCSELEQKLGDLQRQLMGKQEVRKADNTTFQSQTQDLLLAECDEGRKDETARGDLMLSSEHGDCGVKTTADAGYRADTEGVSFVPSPSKPSLYFMTSVVLSCARVLNEEPCEPVDEKSGMYALQQLLDEAFRSHAWKRLRKVEVQTAVALLKEWARALEPADSSMWSPGRADTFAEDDRQREPNRVHDEFTEEPQKSENCNHDSSIRQDSTFAKVHQLEVDSEQQIVPVKVFLDTTAEGKGALPVCDVLEVSVTKSEGAEPVPLSPSAALKQSGTLCESFSENHKTDFTGEEGSAMLVAGTKRSRLELAGLPQIMKKKVKCEVVESEKQGESVERLLKPSFHGSEINGRLEKTDDNGATKVDEKTIGTSLELIGQNLHEAKQEGIVRGCEREEEDFLALEDDDSMEVGDTDSELAKEWESCQKVRQIDANSQEELNVGKEGSGEEMTKEVCLTSDNKFVDKRVLPQHQLGEICPLEFSDVSNSDMDLDDSPDRYAGGASSGKSFTNQEFLGGETLTVDLGHEQHECSKKTWGVTSLTVSITTGFVGNAESKGKKEMERQDTGLEEAQEKQPGQLEVNHHDQSNVALSESTEVGGNEGQAGVMVKSMYVKKSRWEKPVVPPVHQGSASYGNTIHASMEGQSSIGAEHFTGESTVGTVQPFEQQLRGQHEDLPSFDFVNFISSCTSPTNLFGGETQPPGQPWPTCATYHLKVNQDQPVSSVVQQHRNVLAEGREMLKKGNPSKNAQRSLETVMNSVSTTNVGNSKHGCAERIEIAGGRNETLNEVSNCQLNGREGSTTEGEEQKPFGSEGQATDLIASSNINSAGACVETAGKATVTDKCKDKVRTEEMHASNGLDRVRSLRNAEAVPASDFAVHKHNGLPERAGTKRSANLASGSRSKHNNSVGNSGDGVQCQQEAKPAILGSTGSLSPIVKTGQEGIQGKGERLDGGRIHNTRTEPTAAEEKGVVKILKRKSGEPESVESLKCGEDMRRNFTKEGHDKRNQEGQPATKNGGSGHVFKGERRGKYGKSIQEMVSAVIICTRDIRKGKGERHDLGEQDLNIQEALKSLLHSRAWEGSKERSPSFADVADGLKEWVLHSVTTRVPRRLQENLEALYGMKIYIAIDENETAPLLRLLREYIVKHGTHLMHSPEVWRKVYRSVLLNQEGSRFLEGAGGLQSPGLSTRAPRTREGSLSPGREGDRGGRSLLHRTGRRPQGTYSGNSQEDPRLLFP